MPAPVHVAPVLEDRISLSYSHVTSSDGTGLQTWSNDPTGTSAKDDSRPTVLLCNGLGTNPYAWPALLAPPARCGWSRGSTAAWADPVVRRTPSA